MKNGEVICLLWFKYNIVEDINDFVYGFVKIRNGKGNIVIDFIDFDYLFEISDCKSWLDGFILILIGSSKVNKFGVNV